MILEEIKSTLTAYIMNKFEIEQDDEEFTADVHLFDYGYIDSFGATELIAFVEVEFGIEVTKKDLMLNSLNTINEIASMIQQKTEGR